MQKNFASNFSVSSFPIRLSSYLPNFLTSSSWRLCARYFYKEDGKIRKLRGWWEFGCGGEIYSDAEALHHNPDTSSHFFHLVSNLSAASFWFLVRRNPFGGGDVLGGRGLVITTIIL